MSVAESSPSGGTPSADPLEHRSTVTGPRPRAGVPNSLAPGDRLGRYRILRALGRGGMGEVYEAEDPDSERRVAIKVLLDKSPTESGRERFLREGRLAAAIDHPNTVYVFGSEEIDGQWAISMEIADGGTLRDMVRREGPLPAARAVDLVLQVVDGLEAAHAVGVLHRDVKPSNCFLQSDGTVKVGDFGLSLSTVTRESLDLTATGALLGTPEFASPEQLRGDEIDVRADVYSVGATLYFLLTGRPPFEEPNLARLLEAISTRTPERPSSLQLVVPPGLSAVILSCLAKDREGRFGDCGALRVALQPFSSRVYLPPSVGRRVAAVILDGLAAYGVARVAAALVDPLAAYALGALAVALPTPVLRRSLGEAACGLVVKRGDVAPPWWWALARGLVHGALVAGAAGILLGTLVQAWWLGPTLLAAFLARRVRGGWQGLAERATGSLVTREVRLAPPEPAATSPVRLSPGAAQVGPYSVVRTLHSEGAVELLEAVDPVLRRRVWIRRLPAGSPPVEIWRRELLRPARLRWLLGRRDANEAWDAYAAPAGAPLADVASRPRPWPEVRGWLLDLAEELAAQTAAGEPAPPLSRRLVWVAGRHAGVSEFPAEGGPLAGHELIESPQRLLYEVATVALFGGPDAGAPPLPSNLRSLLTDLRDGNFGSPAEIVRVLRVLAVQADRVTALDRLESFAVPAAIVAMALTGIGGDVAQRFQRTLRPSHTVPLALMRLQALESGALPGDPRERRTLERHVVLNYEGLRSLGDEPVPYLRPVARRVLQGASASQLALEKECDAPYAEYRPDATAAFRLGVLRTAGGLHWGLPLLMLAAVVGSRLWLPIGRLPSPAETAKIAPLHLLRVGDLVRSDGTRAGPLAGIVRNVLRWTPLALLPAAYWWSGEVGLALSVAAVIVLYGAGMAWTLLQPERGPLERLTGTAVVPRDLEVDMPGPMGRWVRTPMDWLTLRRLADLAPDSLTPALRHELQALMDAPVAAEPASPGRGRLAAAMVLLVSAAAAAGAYHAMRSGLPPTPGRPSEDCRVKQLRDAAIPRGPQALVRLGWELETGYGLKRDLAAAHDTYALAAAAGDADAACRLGRTYQFGLGVVADLAQAAHWYRRAAERDHREAQRRLGGLYQRGEGVERDPQQARHWLEQAAVSDAYAPGFLGYQAEGGDGLPADRAASLKWYRLGAERGDPYAMNRLGHEASHRGDALAAEGWFRMAAKAGDPAGRFHLGRLLFSSSRPGVAVEAHAWLTLAARHTQKREGQAAAALLERLDAKLTPDERARADAIRALYEADPPAR